MFKRLKYPLLGIGLLFLFGGGVLVFVPAFSQRVAFVFYNLQSHLYTLINPPEKEVFVPEGDLDWIVSATLTAWAGSPTAPANTQIPSTPEMNSTATPFVTLEPLPVAFAIEGVTHEYQKWNNCGPATLSMALSAWGWEGDQGVIAAALKPNSRDKNVSPEELVDFVNQQTSLKALMRVGGSIDTLKRLISQGFVVVIEKGHDGFNDDGWMGHYQLLNAYDDARQRFIAQDSLIMPDLPEDYVSFEGEWRAFDYLYIVVYAPEREQALLSILGAASDVNESCRIALRIAETEIPLLSGRDAFFALFNQGSAQVCLQDYPAAAGSYDAAFLVLADMDEKIRPWRMMWYQHGPYRAYFEVGRYNDVINLADYALSRTSEPALEESFYWRARSRTALGDQDGAINDLRQGLQQHPGYAPILEEMGSLGVAP